MSNNTQFTPVRKAVIPIAGFGTRMFPASKAVPKALFPIVDVDGFCKPILQVIIEEALSIPTMEQICIVVQNTAQQASIEEYFCSEPNAIYYTKSDLVPQIEKIKEIGKRLHFAIQEKPQGFGHAVLCAKDFVGSEPFVVMLGDHVYTTHNSEGKTCAQQVAEQYQKYGKSVTSLGLCHESELSVNGVVNGKKVANEVGGRLFALETSIEKPSVEAARQHLRAEGLPADQYMCFFGIDLLSPKLFEFLERNQANGVLTKGELQLRDAMKNIMEDEGMYGYLVEGDRHDTGMPHEYAAAMSALNQVALQRAAARQEKQQQKQQQQQQ